MSRPLRVLPALWRGARCRPLGWKPSLCTAGGLEPDGLEGPFQPKPFYDSTSVCLFRWMFLSKTLLSSRV